TRVIRPEPATTSGSPTLTFPDTTVPEKPRNAASGRFTHCTGKRSGAVSSAPLTSIVSRWASSEGPSYQCVRLLERATLSPSRAEIGTASSERRLQGLANASKAPSISRKRRCEKSTRSILLTASTTSRMPSRWTIAAWRRVCSTSPLRASTSSTARSTLEAPVAMLRVNCRWPGVSATTKARRGLAKKRWATSMVMPCSRSASSPSSSSAKSTLSPVVPKRRESSRNVASWSSSRPVESAINRPISVDLPSSTEPQARKRSAFLCSATSISEVALALLALHRLMACAVDQAASALGESRDAQLVDHRGYVFGIRIDRAGQRPAAERPEAHAPGLHLFVGVQMQALVVDCDPGIAAVQDLPVGGEVERHDRNSFGLDVGPHVGLGPIRQREGAHGLARREPQVVVAPQLRLLVARIPGVARRAAREDPLLGARLFLVAAAAADRHVEAVAIERLTQRFVQHQPRVLAGFGGERVDAGAGRLVVAMHQEV